MTHWRVAVRTDGPDRVGGDIVIEERDSVCLFLRSPDDAIGAGDFGWLKMEIDAEKIDHDAVIGTLEPERIVAPRQIGGSLFQKETPPVG